MRPPEWNMDDMPSWMRVGSTCLALIVGLLLLRKLFAFFLPSPVNEALNRSDDDESAPPLSSIKPFRLFDLPGEIRNLIYEYVVSEPDGLRYVETRHGQGVLLVIDSGTDVTPNKPRLANPLRWVNFQLRQETRRMELLFNDLYFRTTEHVENLQLFANFLSKCPTQLHPYLRTITLEPDLSVERIGCQMALSARKVATYTLTGFCLHNPLVSVRWRWEDISQTNCWFVQEAVVTSVNERHSFDFARKVANGSKHLEDVFVRSIRQLNPHTADPHFCHEPGLPHNLRILPVEVHFDEMAFRTLLAGSDLGGFIELFGGNVDYWVSLAREIYVNGL